MIFVEEDMQGFLQTLLQYPSINIHDKHDRPGPGQDPDPMFFNQYLAPSLVHVLAIVLSRFLFFLISQRRFFLILNIRQDSL
jgi:hypothetical protein